MNTAEKRANLRHACSVLTEIFVVCPDGTKYFGGGIIADISESGAALTTDVLPSADTLHLRNSYFEARCEVRNRVRLPEDGYRIGVQFSAPLHWKDETAAPAENDTHRLSSPTPKRKRGAQSSKKRPRTDLQLLERIIANARRKFGLVEAEEADGAQGEAEVENPLLLPSKPALLKCRACQKEPCCWKQLGDIRIPLAVCKSCLLKSAPFMAADANLRTDACKAQGEGDETPRKWSPAFMRLLGAGGFWNG